jgi:hypothetical protein
MIPGERRTHLLKFRQLKFGLPKPSKARDPDHKACRPKEKKVLPVL